MTRSPGKASKKPAKQARTKTSPDISRALVGSAVVPPMIVDAHCHTFNASDLSKRGFVREVLLDSDEKIILRLIEPFVLFLVNLLTRAPGFQEEVEHLESLHVDGTQRIRTAQLQAHATERATIDQEHWQNVANELQRVSLSSNGQEHALFEALMEEVYPGGMQALAIADDVESTAKLARRIASSQGVLSRYIRWVGRLRHLRADIISELIQTYGEEPSGVRLFVSALVDFQFWLDDKPSTNFSEQIELGARLVRAFPGRVHFFAPFDPWREIAHGQGEATALDLVKKAVTENGFLGVKLYPPMGFAASGNASLDFSQVGVKDSPAFGAQIDRALHGLFEWAIAEDVPIMAHCNLSEQSKHGFALRASPAFWGEVLSKHRGLRLNLGHFGGQPNLGPGGVNEAADWPETIVRLMGELGGERLFTDVGNFNMRDSGWFGTLNSVTQKSPVLLSRLMYGSDWMMLATSAGYEEFLTLFRSGLVRHAGLTDAQVGAILGENARSFLGLNPGEKPRMRLEAFYDAHNIPRPTWLR